MREAGLASGPKARPSLSYRTRSVPQAQNAGRSCERTSRTHTYASREALRTVGVLCGCGPRYRGRPPCLPVRGLRRLLRRGTRPSAAPPRPQAAQEFRVRQAALHIHVAKLRGRRPRASTWRWPCRLESTDTQADGAELPTASPAAPSEAQCLVQSVDPPLDLGVRKLSHQDRHRPLLLPVCRDSKQLSTRASSRPETSSGSICVAASRISASSVSDHGKC